MRRAAARAITAARSLVTASKRFLTAANVSAPAVFRRPGIEERFRRILDAKLNPLRHLLTDDHDLAGGYEMPEEVARAFEGVIRPRLG